MKKLYFLAVLSALVLLYSGCVVENEEPPRPVELVISEQPTKVEYKKGDELDLSGLKVTLKKSDDTSEVLEKGKYTAVPSDGTVLAEPGKKTVTITAEGLSATFTITVTEPEEKPDVSAVELVISKQPTKVSYEKGDKLNLSGLEITLHKTDGTSELLTEYKTVPEEGTELTASGEKTVTVTAEGLSATFTITVTAPEGKPDEPTDRLEISKQPTKVGYEKGDKLDLSGLEVTLHKADGTSEVLTQYTTEPENGSPLTEPGETTVTITAEGLSATFTITVTEPEEKPDVSAVELVISEQPTKTVYKKGDELDLSGLEVTLKKSDGTSEVLEEGRYTAEPEEGTELTEPGEKTVRITAEGLSATFTITVAAPERLEISKQPTKVGYEKGDKLDLSGLEVTLHKTDGTSEVLTQYTTEPVNGSELTRLGKQSVTITAEGLEMAFDICVAGLEIVRKPWKTNYSFYTPLNLDGLEVKLYRTDGTSEIFREYTVEPKNRSMLENAGRQQVKITAEGQEEDFEIFVSDEYIVYGNEKGELVQKWGYGDEEYETILEKVKKIKVADTVTSIGSFAFYGCRKLTSVEIPSGVTSIGSSAFEGCSSLISVKIPSSVTSIGSSAFSKCSSLTSVEIPSGVTSIGSSAFYRCSSLISVEIPSSVTSIGNLAFNECSGLRSVEISSGIKSIGVFAFNKCSSLISVKIPSSVTSIGKGVFYECTSLTSVEISSSVTTIESETFNHCSNLTSVEIPASVTKIGWRAFNDCGLLVSVTYSGSEEQWKKIEVYNENLNLVGTMSVEDNASIVGLNDKTIVYIDDDIKY